MSRLIRFEFYNNFDIWYDLYQENGGDPNYIINMMMYINKNILGHGQEYGDGSSDIYDSVYEGGHGYGYGYINECIEIDIDIDGTGNGNGHGDRFIFERGCRDSFYGSLFFAGNGTW